MWGIRVTLYDWEGGALVLRPQLSELWSLDGRVNTTNGLAGSTEYDRVY